MGESGDNKTSNFLRYFKGSGEAFFSPKMSLAAKNQTPFSVQNLGWILVGTNSPWTDVNKDALIEGSQVPWSETNESKLLLGGFNSSVFFGVKLKPKNTQERDKHCWNSDNEPNWEQKNPKNPMLEQIGINKGKRISNHHPEKVHLFCPFHRPRLNNQGTTNTCLTIKKSMKKTLTQCLGRHALFGVFFHPNSRMVDVYMDVYPNIYIYVHKMHIDKRIYIYIQIDI